MAIKRVKFDGGEIVQIAPEPSIEYERFKQGMRGLEALLEDELYKDIHEAISLLKTDVNILFGQHEAEKHGLVIPDKDNCQCTEATVSHSLKELIDNMTDALNTDETMKGIKSEQVHKELTASTEELFKIMKDKEQERITKGL